MGDYVAAFRRCVEKRGNPKLESVVEVLYNCYCMDRNLDTEQIRECFYQINKTIEKLTLKENDRIIDLTCKLCDQYQQVAFQEGLLVALRLFQELAVFE